MFKLMASLAAAFLVLIVPSLVLGGQEKKKAEVVDLVAKAELGDQKGDTGWKSPAKGQLVATAVWPAREVLAFDYEAVPAEYDLALVVERLDAGTKDFDVGLVAPGGTCAYHFDAYDATKSCVALIDGNEGEYAQGQVFRKGKPRTVQLLVRADGLTVMVDGKRLWKGKVPWAKAGLHPAVKVAGKSRPFIVAAGGSWRVTGATMTVPQ